MRITKHQLRRIIRESLLVEKTSFENFMGEPSPFVEANWLPWLEARGLDARNAADDLDDLAKFAGAPDRSWLSAEPPANNMIGPADLELWAAKRSGR